MNTSESNARSAEDRFWRAVAFAIVAFAVGGVVGHYFWPTQFLQDRPAKYILMFGDSTSKKRVTVDLPAFEAALASPEPAPNWMTLKKKDGR